jgi:RNA polymerase sigma-70 factor (ECF subfamily)
MNPAEELLPAVAAALPAVPVARFADQLAERLRAGADPHHAADLVLAAACLAGHPAALAILERDHLAAAAAALTRRRLPPADVDEVLQQLREKLLLGERPRLLDYAGRGPLRSFLRVAALRTAHNLRRAAGPLAPPLAAELIAPDDAELAALELRHAAEIKRALQAGLLTLGMRERTVFRLHLLDGLSLEEIGRLYGVNKSSVSRWLGAARAHLLDTARRELAARLDPGDLASLVRAFSENLDLSLTRLLRDPA